MADYTTLNDVKTAMNITVSDDDDYLEALIASASRWVDSYCQRHFVGNTETRYYDAIADIEGNTLYLDDDLLDVTILTNGDGNVVSVSEYTLLPTNLSPKYAIKLKQSASVSWTYTTDPEASISVTGSWGYSSGTPDNIQQAAKRLVVWMYKQRDVPFLEVGVPEGGFATVTVTMPNDIRNLLNPYKRYGV